MKDKDYSLGIFLIFIGLLFLLLNLRVLPFEWLLFMLSIGILIGYFVKRHLGYLVLGLVLLGISSIMLLNKYIFIGIDIENFLFLWIFGVISLILYGKQKSKALLIIGMLLIALGVNNLVEELIEKDVNWILYLTFGVAFYMIYLIGYRKSKVEWPKHLGIIMIVISLFSLLSSQKIFTLSFWKFVLYLLPILLIAIGIKIIYSAVKQKK